MMTLQLFDIVHVYPVFLRISYYRFFFDRLHRKIFLVKVKLKSGIVMLFKSQNDSQVL